MVDEKRMLIARMAHRDEWLAQVEEEALDPEREIVDPHHHLWNRGGSVYELDRLWQDTGDGHNVVQTVFIECRAGYRTDGPEHLRPVGETEYVVEMAKASRDAEDKATIAGIVAHADLRLPPAALDAALDAHAEAADGLFRGIRHAGSHAPDPTPFAIPGRAEADLYADPDFERGINRLGERGLTYDTWHYHFQAGDFLRLARACPDTVMVLDHLSVPLGIGEWAGKRAEIFVRWKDDMAALAECKNVVAKLGGMAMPDNGWGWHERAAPPTSEEFINVQGDWYMHMIDCFGPDRCMFESNFPVDRVSIGYRVFWNGAKKLVSSMDEGAKAAMFAGTARRVYAL